MCIVGVKSFYIVIKSQIVMYSKLVEFSNNYFKSDINNDF